MVLPVIAGYLTAQNLGIGAAVAGAFTFMDPVRMFATQTGMRVIPVAVPDPYVYTRLHWLFPQGPDKPYFSQLKKHGYGASAQDDIINASIRVPTIEEVVRLFRLGVLAVDKPVVWKDYEGREHTWTLEDFLRALQIPHGLRPTMLNLSRSQMSVGLALSLHRRYGEYLPVGEDVLARDYPWRPVTPDDRRIITPGTPPLVEPSDVPSTGFDRLLIAAKRFEGLHEIPDEMLYQAHAVYPQVQDLIRFAIREVFTPELAEKLGLFEDMPADFITESRKAGLKPEHASQFWAAHWLLPSYQMGREMLHRRIITPEKFSMLLRVLDYSPAWRKELTAVAYRVRTRVDLRRLYRDGIIPKRKGPEWTADDELVKAYQDYGYTIPNSIQMAAWTERRYTPKTIASAIKLATTSYERGYIEDEDFQGMLRRIGITDEARKILFTGSRAKRALKALDTLIKKAKARLKDGLVGEEEFRRLLAEYGLSTSTIERVINDARAEEAPKTKGLTNAETLRLFKKGLIKTEIEAVALLEANGRTPEAARLLVLEAKKQRDTGAGTVDLGRMLSWWKRRWRTDAQFRAYLQARGWQPWQVELAVREGQEGA